MSDMRVAERDPAVAIELVDVTKRYGSAVALDGVSMRIAEGEFFCLLGPSGCGKTTTLNLIGGFIPMSGGELRIQGVRVNDLPPHKRNVNTVFQSYALFPHMTVEQNIAFGLRMEGLGDHDRRARVSEYVELVGMAGMERRLPAQLSGGQQQRVALARALAKRPAVLLLDEPLGALDLKLRRQMQIELSRIHRQVGTTFVFVTHDQEEALSMATRIAVMSQGRVVQLGTPREIYYRPVSRFVADFIGESNFLSGSVERDASGSRITLLGGAIAAHRERCGPWPRDAHGPSGGRGDRDAGRRTLDRPAGPDRGRRVHGGPHAHHRRDGGWPGRRPSIASGWG